MGRKRNWRGDGEAEGEELGKRWEFAQGGARGGFEDAFDALFRATFAGGRGAVGRGLGVEVAGDLGAPAGGTDPGRVAPLPLGLGLGLHDQLEEKKEMREKLSWPADVGGVGRAA